MQYERLFVHQVLPNKNNYRHPSPSISFLRPNDNSGVPPWESQLASSIFEEESLSTRHILDTAKKDGRGCLNAVNEKR